MKKYEHKEGVRHLLDFLPLPRIDHALERIDGRHEQRNQKHQQYHGDGYRRNHLRSHGIRGGNTREELRRIKDNMTDAQNAGGNRIGRNREPKYELWEKIPASITAAKRAVAKVHC